MSSSLTKQLGALNPWLRIATQQLRFARTESAPPRRRSKSRSTSMPKTSKDKSEWWIVDGEMHEIGDHVPPRERFVIPRDNIPNKRRKQLREQFMRRTRLVIKESEHEPWCRRYMELYQELRENWERLYWDEGFSKKIAQDHANYDSADDDDFDFNPHKSNRRPPGGDQMKEQGLRGNRQGDNWEKVNQVRDKFEYDRERRMRERAFAPMNGRPVMDSQDLNSRNQPFNTQRYFPDNERN
ncbi:hypothetical protein Ddye_015224 [Dipteronia dyeriana]|uniref:Uncharacterized protein n=1 Tax=Dipteronia dyeriana TaxID=168575 RepID=A0AAD9U4F6_9ROSI|nr:hypothetical protein Ddye_015224 [Dipteronia dyeriana]